MTAAYLAERPVRSFPQIERPGPTLYAAERPFSSRAFGTLPPYLPDVAGLFDFDIQLSAVHSEIHIWGAAMPISIQLSATAYPIEYATADFTTSVELEVGKLAEYPFAIELSATVKMVADAAYQQAINLAATAYPVEIQTGPLTLATALSASAYPVELQTAVDNVALQLSATGYPIEISSASASLATALTAAGYPIELGGTVPAALTVAFTATAYESVFAPSGMTKNGSAQTFTAAAVVTGMVAESGSTLVGSALIPNGAKTGATIAAQVYFSNTNFISSITAELFKNGVLVPGGAVTVSTVSTFTATLVIPTRTVDVISTDQFTLKVTPSSSIGATIGAGTATFVRIT